MLTGVYQILNKTNNKKYIGSTTDHKGYKIINKTRLYN
jgi:GIY-YIG catalytic domain